MDVFSAKPDLEHLLFETGSAARLAGHVDVGEELHLDFFEPVSRAQRAAPTVYIEAERAGGEAAVARRTGGREELSDGRISLEIREGVRARRSTDRRLIDEDQVLNELQAVEAVTCARLARAFAFPLPVSAIEDVLDQSALAGARDPGDRHHDTERDLDIDVLKIVLFGPADPNRVPLAPSAPRVPPRNAQPAGEVLAGQSVRRLHQLGRRSIESQLTTALAGARAEVHDSVGAPNHFRFVLYDHDGVIVVAQPFQDVHQPRGVPWMQADGGLVQHVERVDQGRAEGGR